MKPNAWLAKILPLGGLGILTLIFFHALVDSEMVLRGKDFQEIHEPLLWFVVRSVHEDRVLPLWNPHQFLGYSVVGNPQYGLFYPPNWLLYLFSDHQIAWGISWLVVGHVFWSGYGVYGLTRIWGGSRLGAIGAGLIFCLNGFLMARIYSGHYALILSASWLPWMFAAYGWVQHRPRFLHSVIASVPFAMCVLAGHPQMAVIGGFGLGMMLINVLAQTKSRQQAFLHLRHWLVMVIIGACLSAVVWLPTWDYSGKTARTSQDDSFSFANQHAIPLPQLTSLVVPHTHGNPMDSVGYWGEPFYEEMTAYVGILPLILLMGGIILRERRIIFWGILAGVGVILSLGYAGGLYWLLNVLIPPLNSFRAPGRFLWLASIGLAVISGLMLTRLEQSNKPIEMNRWRGWVAGMAIFGILLWGSGLYLHNTGKTHQIFVARQCFYSGGWTFLMSGAMWILHTHHKNLTLKLSVLVVIIGLGVMDVGRVAGDLVEFTPNQESRVWTAVEESIPPTETGKYGRILQMSPVGIPNGASVTGHYSVQGYDPISPREWAMLAEAAGPFRGNPHSAVNRIFGVRYAITALPLQDYYIGYEDVYVLNYESDGLFIYENPLALPRAYLAQQYVLSTDPSHSYDLITANAVYQGDTVILEKDVACVGGEGTATITRYTPNHVEIEVNADGDSLLILGDQYDDDWRVEIDGKSASLLRVNTVVRGVCVPSGRHQVVFKYRPWSFYIGGILSIMAWGGMLGLGITRIMKKRLDDQERSEQTKL